MTNMPTGENEIELRFIFALLWRGKWWLIVTMLTVVVACVVLVYSMTPIYRASVILMPASMDRSQGSALESAAGQLGGLASLAGINIGGGDAETERALAVLKSREFTERFISSQSLMPELFNKYWDPVNKKWNLSPQKIPTGAKAFKLFNKDIRTVVQDKKTGLFTLQIDWRDRLEAARWANELVDRLNSEMRERAIVKSDASIGYLENEQKVTAVVATQQAVGRLLEAQEKQKMFATVTPEFAFSIVDRALPPDADDPISPRKLLIVAAGVIAGFALGVGLLIFLHLSGYKRVP